MLTLKVISRLLCYPSRELLAALDEMEAAIEAEALLPAVTRRALRGLIAEFRATDLYILQERYVNLFDRGRALSLHLFEHVHGESRDRGQAMVDLMNLYRSHGFALAARELPDHLPVFLEYLSQRPAGEARALLTDAIHVVALLGERLAQRESGYRVLLEALQAFAGTPGDLEAIREQVAGEGPDETLVNMDRVWEEEAVTFLASGGGCSDIPREQPVRWVKPGNATPATDSVSGGQSS